MNFTGAILIGGMGKRFGGDKTGIIINGETIIKRIIREFDDLFDEILFVGRRVFEKCEGGHRCVEDIFKFCGSIGGIHSALLHSKNPYCFIIACDMPFVKTGFIEHMLKFIREDESIDVVIPESENRLEPLCAVYSKRCIPFFENLIKDGEKRIIRVLDYVKVKTISYKGGIEFFNINTPQELKKAEDIIKSTKGS